MFADVNLSALPYSTVTTVMEDVVRKVAVVKAQSKHDVFLFPSQHMTPIFLYVIGDIVAAGEPRAEPV